VLVVEGWNGILLLAAWGIIASLVSLYLGYRRYVQRDEEREKRCHHILDVDQRIVLLEALNLAQNALRGGAAVPSDYGITTEKLDEVYKLIYWAEGIELKAPSPFDKNPEPGLL